jgi:hypothetical protein
MIIQYKTPEAENNHIAYEVEGNKVTFGDDEKMLNLAKYERDETVHLIDSVDADGNLVGSGEGIYYVYEIDIPARAYVDSEGEPDEETGEATINHTAVAFDIEKCALTLWKMEG